MVAEQANPSLDGWLVYNENICLVELDSEADGDNKEMEGTIPAVEIIN